MNLIEKLQKYDEIEDDGERFAKQYMLIQDAVEFRDFTADEIFEINKRGFDVGYFKYERID